jgi:hypothetical protein
VTYKAVVGWWFYGAASDTGRANLFASYGLMDSLAAPPVGGGWTQTLFIPVLSTVNTVVKMIRRYI